MCLAALTACGGGSKGSDDTVQAASTGTAKVAASVGRSSQPLTIAFTTSDGKAANNLRITSDLSALPDGWSVSGNSFTCTAVSSGSSCVLTLTYAPGKVASGILTLAYSYNDNQGAPKSGSIDIPYSSTVDDNIIGTVSPTGQVAAVVGAGSRDVTVNFTTDDGNPASSFALTTDLTTLPSGWGSAANAKTCATVSTGNGCQVVDHLRAGNLLCGQRRHLHQLRRSGLERFGRTSRDHVPLGLLVCSTKDKDF